MAPGAQAAREVPVALVERETLAGLAAAPVTRRAGGVAAARV